MSNDPKNTTSSAESARPNIADGIPLRASEPLSYDPFVHVTLDAVEKPIERPKPVSSETTQVPVPPRPVWAQQRMFSHAPERNTRIARTFPNQKEGALERSSGKVEERSSFGSARLDDLRQAKPAPRSDPRSSGSSAAAEKDASVASGSSEPALRVVLENKDADSAATQSAEGKVGIGKDHISVPSDLYAQDELDELAASMPPIPKNLIFNKDDQTPQALSMPRSPSRMPFRGVRAPVQNGLRGAAYPRGASMPASYGAAGGGANSASPDPFLSGNPRNALGNQGGMSMGVAPSYLNGTTSNITPSVAAVPASTDYRPYAASAMGMPYNPLRPYAPGAFDVSSRPLSGWMSQSEMAASGAYGSYPASMSGSLAASVPSPGNMPRSMHEGMYGADPFDPMGANLRSSGASSAYGSDGGNPQGTLPSGMPVSFDSVSSSSYASRNMNDIGSASPYRSQGFNGQARSSGFNARSSNPAFPSNGDQGIPLDKGTPIPRDSFVKPVSKESRPDASDSASLFDQPPVPITEGMKSADTSHKKLRRVIIIVLLAVVLALGGIVGYLVYSGTVNPDELVPHITIEAPSGDSGSSGGSASGSSSSSGSASTDDAGSVVYQYTALTSDGTAYTVEETATFSDEGYCEFTTMKMKFPDAEKAKSFTDNLARDYGSSFTLDVLDGANATVTIDNSSLHLDREKYEESLRYSVEDLVILKK